MSIIAGIYRRSSDLAALERGGRELEKGLGATRPESLRTGGDGRWRWVQADYGCWGSEGVHEGAGRVTVVAGHPYLRVLEGGEDRAAHVEALQGEGDWSETLRRADGTWCGARYEAGAERLTLATDKLGVRPLYYYECEDYVVFSSALWLLEQVECVRKVVDLRDGSLVANLSYPLGRATQYEGIWRLYGGEAVEFAGGELRSWRYFRLEATQVEQAPVGELARRVAEGFRQAVARRVAGDTGVVGFLSGGLDSRVITSVLREQGRRVAAYNFSMQRTLDRTLSEQYAAANGVEYHSARLLPGRPVVESLAAAWAQGEVPTFAPERPRLAWSGDGGSVCLGLVYLTREIEALLRGGRQEEAGRRFLQDQGGVTLPRMFHGRLRARAERWPYERVQREMERVGGSDPVRRFYFFLLLNDQRHHMERVYERVHEHRFELQLPFFDGALLEAVAAVPSAELGYHHFYNLCLKELPADIQAQPWQTYPEHEECPLPMPATQMKQWTREYNREVHRQRLRDIVKAGERTKAHLPGEVFGKGYLGLARLLGRMGSTRLDYALKQSARWGEWFEAAEGRWVEEPASRD